MTPLPGSITTLIQSSSSGSSGNGRGPDVDSVVPIALSTGRFETTQILERI